MVILSVFCVVDSFWFVAELTIDISQRVGH